MNSFFRIIVSLGITFGLSALIASLFSAFWSVFGLCAVLQFVGFYFYNQAYSNRMLKDFETIKISQIAEMNRNNIVVGCPCDDKNKQTVDYRFDSDNVFECEKCGKNFRVSAKISTVLTTDPIYFNKTDG